MGLFEKMKNLFTDEIEEEPIKTEVRQVEIPAPIKEESKEELTKLEPPKEEEKSPIFFDDDYFKELEQPKKEVKSSYLKEQVKLKEEKKQFKPTPIISPIYGILDKNYNKDDISPKKVIRSSYTNTNITIDDVRKKAYGTLEDDLESSLFTSSDDLFNEMENKPDAHENEHKTLTDNQGVHSSDDIFDTLARHASSEEIVKPEIKIEEEPIKIIDDVNVAEDDINKATEELQESDLFDLIDDMYDKGE